MDFGQILNQYNDQIKCITLVAAYQIIYCHIFRILLTLKRRFDIEFGYPISSDVNNLEKQQEELRFEQDVITKTLQCEDFQNQDQVDLENLKQFQIYLNLPQQTSGGIINRFQQYINRKIDNLLLSKQQISYRKSIRTKQWLSTLNRTQLFKQSKQIMEQIIKFRFNNNKVNMNS